MIPVDNLLAYSYRRPIIVSDGTTKQQSKGGDRMKNQAITLAAFCDYIDTVIEDGGNEATVAVSAFLDGLHPDDLKEAIKYAAGKEVKLNFIVETDDYEPDYNPQNEDRANWLKEQRLQKSVDLFSNPISQ